MTDDSDEELTRIQRAMIQINASHREILVLVCAKGMGYEEVSCMLKITIGTVRSRLSIAREELQSIMDMAPASTFGQFTVLKKSTNASTPVVPAYIAFHKMQKRA